MLKLEVENAYGLKGNHSFVFKPGLNVLLCSNAKGASSTIKSLGLLGGQTCLDGAIHESANAANVKLQVDRAGYYLSLKRASGQPAVMAAELLDPRALDCIIVNENHPLCGHLDSESVKRFITRAADLSRLSEQKHEQEREYDAKRAQLSEIRTTTEGLKKIEAENLKVEDRIQELRESRAALLRKMPKKASPVAQGLLEQVYSQVAKCRNDIQDFRRVMREKQQALVKAEAALASYEAQANIPAVQREIEEVKLTKLNFEEEKQRYSKLIMLASALEGLGHLAECPACAIFSVHSDWSKLPDETFLPTLKNFGGHKMIERTELEKKVDNCTRELRDLDNRCKGANDDIAERKRVCSEVRSELNTLDKYLKEKQRELATANSELHDLSRKLGREGTLRIKIHDVKHELELLEKQRDELKGPIEELRKAKAAEARVAAQIKDAEKAFNQTKAALDNALSNAKQIFNKTAKSLLHEVGLRNFREVAVDNDFHIRVVREDCVEFATELSTSESTTLIVLLALAAKRAYYPSFPFFALDTITTSYNISAHKRFIEFLGRESDDHVIVTLLAPNEQELKVLQEFPAAEFKMVK